MQNKQFNLSALFYFLSIGIMLIFIAIIAQNILVPIVFGILFGFVLRPPVKFLDDLGFHPILSIVLVLLGISLIISGLIFFFSSQIFGIVDGLNDIQDKIQLWFNQVLNFAEKYFSTSKQETKNLLKDNLGTLASTPFSALASGSSVLASMGFTLIYTFLFLLYRSAFKNFLIAQIAESKREKAKDLIQKIQAVAQSYLNGLLLVILILGVLNSIGLWIIGIDHPFLFGFLGAFLAIIPYVGSFAGMVLPLIYALMTTDNFWQPFAIVLLFGTVQQLEGNLLTPKIIGNKVSLNPLIVIFSMIVAASIWGLAGLILAIPLVAILKVIFENIERYKPLALLMSSDFYKSEKTFLHKFDHKKYRLLSFFMKKKNL